MEHSKKERNEINRLETFLSSNFKKERFSDFKKQVRDEFLESFYKETEKYHNQLSDAAITSLVYIVVFLGKRNHSIISKNNLKIFLSNIKIIDGQMTHLDISSELNKTYAELKTQSILIMIKKYFNIDEQKILFNNAIKVETIKTILMKLNHREYFIDENFQIKNKYFLKKYFLDHYIPISEDNVLDKKIKKHIIENIEKAVSEVKIMIYEKYEKDFSDDDKYAFFKNKYEKKLGNTDVFLLMFTHKCWLNQWKRLVSEKRKPLNKEVSEKWTYDFFIYAFDSETMIKREEIASFLLDLGYNFKDRSLDYSYLGSIENKKEFVIKTLKFKKQVNKINIDFNILKNIESMIKLIPPLDQLRIYNELNMLYYVNKKDQTMSSFFWNTQAFDMLKKYIFDYCNDDLSIDDDMFDLFIMKYSI